MIMINRNMHALSHNSPYKVRIYLAKTKDASSPRRCANVEAAGYPTKQQIRNTDLMLA